MANARELQIDNLFEIDGGRYPNLTDKHAFFEADEGMMPSDTRRATLAKVRDAER